MRNKLLMIVLVVITVILTVKGALAAGGPPTTPRVSAPGEILVADTLAVTPYGSKDYEGDVYSYLCRFVVVEEEKEIQGFSKDCEITVSPALSHKTIAIYIKATDGMKESEMIFTTVKVVEYRSVNSPTPSFTCPPGNEPAKTRSGIDYCRAVSKTTSENVGEENQSIQDRVLSVGAILWPSSPLGGILFLIVIVMVVINYVLNSREQQKMKSRMQVLDNQRRVDDDDEWL
jgi:hypothetical protein